MTTTERLLSDVRDYVIAPIFHLLPWWAWLLIVWGLLAPPIALAIGTSIRRNRGGDDYDIAPDDPRDLM